MRFSFWPGSNNTWESTLALALHAEKTGWDGIWYPDHLMPGGGDVGTPIAESWTILAALAARVPRVRLGTMVSSNTFRFPPVLAKMAANVDIISGGRVVLGLGGGWQDNEHAAYDIPFYDAGTRLRRLEESVQIIQSLWKNERTTFQGKHYTIVDAPLSPKPVQQPIPLLIGGGGEKVTLRIAAKYADEWNTWGLPDVFRRKIPILEQHCADAGRDPKAIKRSAIAMLVHSDDQSKVDRIVATGRPTLGGNTARLKSVIQEYIDAGVDELLVPDFNLGRTVESKIEVMDGFMSEVASAFK